MTKKRRTLSPRNMMACLDIIRWEFYGMTEEDTPPRWDAIRFALALADKFDREGLDAEVPLSYFQKSVGLTQSQASKWSNWVSQYGWADKSSNLAGGPTGHIQVFELQEDRRNRGLKLTAKGKALVTRLLGYTDEE